MRQSEFNSREFVAQKLCWAHAGFRSLVSLAVWDRCGKGNAFACSEPRAFDPNGEIGVLNRRGHTGVDSFISLS